MSLFKTGISQPYPVIHVTPRGVHCDCFAGEVVAKLMPNPMHQSICVIGTALKEDGRIPLGLFRFVDSDESKVLAFLKKEVIRHSALHGYLKGILA
ncbi:hypothetical protein [Massilia sp. NR 4-1]|uniref:hypothetical protein n=1 Tax=Massilia sp. NR 4-1 TaxID=1678028 RepID=UPI001CBD682A|nr:hypothetical protein [Massilia sp. NR 4-1]